MDDFTLINTSINNFIKNQVKIGNVKGVVIGMSGGIDSSVAAYSASGALGKENVLGLILPDKDITPQQDIDDALEVCSVLEIEYKIIYINSIRDQILNNVEKTDNNLVKGNMLSRIRMCILYYYANLLNRFVLGTANKTEIAIGYFTKYGDGARKVLEALLDKYADEGIENKHKEIFLDNEIELIIATEKNGSK